MRANKSQCNEPYAENDVIPILPTLPTDIARLNLRIKTLKEKGLTHALKKAPGSKKRKKHAEKEAATTTVDDDETTTQSGTNGTKGSDEDKKPISTEAKKHDKPAPAANNGIKNASTASLTRKVLEEQEERNKRRKLTENDNVKSLFRKSDDKPDMKKSGDYMSRGFTIGRK
jgi:hypothetical protein